MLFLIGTSCTEKEKVQYETSFFDISHFVDSLLDVKSTSEINREIIINGQKEQVKLENNDLTEILEFLKQFNINRPKWYDKYTIRFSGNEVFYKAIEEDFEIKEMKVIKNDQKDIEEIQIYYKSNTLISNTEKMIIWKPNNRLDYKNTSKSLWSEPQYMDISWTYSL